MIQIRKHSDRGLSRTDWLDSRHSFSFAGYFDPAFVGFRSLRVLNEDRVAPGAGFEAHAHRDMEILSYVVSGQLEHRDDLGNGSIIRPGDLQWMRAGTGVTHSEFNPSEQEPVHFLQVWIMPRRRGLAPDYQQRAFPLEERRGRLRLLASKDGRQQSLRLDQDVSLYGTSLEAGEALEHGFSPGRAGWLQVVRGRLALDGQALEAGDGAAIAGQPSISIDATGDCEALLFDLA